MSTSAEVTYSAVAVGGVFKYQVVLWNTSPAPFEVYAFQFGVGYNVPLGTFPLEDVVFISIPQGWSGVIEPFALTFSTQYLLPGQSAVFVFQSKTPPPDELPFGCCFYNSNNAWGFPFNGIAKNNLAQRKASYFAAINPLVLLLGDEVFVRLNLPLPQPTPSDLRAQLAPEIRSMKLAQREAAAKALDARIASLTEVRAMLNEGEAPASAV